MFVIIKQLINTATEDWNWVENVCKALKNKGI